MPEDNACWFVRTDPCGMFSAGLTLLLLLYSQIIVVHVLILPWFGGFTWHIVFYSICTVLATVAHILCQFCNPGTIPKRFIKPIRFQALRNEQGELLTPNPRSLPRICRRCQTVKPIGCHHCRTCGRCIMKMDHHCPWVNNCIALYNQKYFILFLFYTALCCLYSGILLMARFVSCTSNLRQCNMPGSAVAFCVINFLEAVVFGLFVTVMLFDQFSAIIENTPGIDALQNVRGKERSKMETLHEVFGESFSFKWFLPLPMSKRVQQTLENELENTRTVFNNLKEQHERILKGAYGVVQKRPTAGVQEVESEYEEAYEEDDTFSC